jgi:hypothetical protein
MSSNNSIFTIFPYKFKGQWMFDDESKGLEQEAFVAGADTLLDILSQGADEVVLLFSDNNFPDSDTVIEMKKTDAGGTYYYCLAHDMDIWLCPALFLYYPIAPKRIYIKVKTTQNVNQKEQKQTVQKNRRPTPQAQSKAHSKKKSTSKTQIRRTKGR